MPNFQSITVSDTSYDGTLFVRTVVPDSDDASSANLLFQTTRGKSIWLPPADCRDLIAWLHHVLGDTDPDTAREPAVLYSTCGSPNPANQLRCVLIGNHEFDATTPDGHCDLYGRRW